MRTDLTNAQYRAMPGISSSDVKAVASKSVAHWKFAQRKASAAFDLGTAVHALVLEPEKDLIMRGPEDRRGNKWKDAALAADLDGKLLLTESDYDTARAMADALFKHKPARDLLNVKGLVAEASFFATDPDTGLQIKCRPDAFAPSGVLLDVKTTQSASPDGFAREVQKYGYHIQAAFYAHVLREAGYDAAPMVFLCVEKETPYAVCVHALTHDYAAYGLAQAKAAMAKIAKAETEGQFTTGWPDVNLLDLPRWMAGPTDDETIDF